MTRNKEYTAEQVIKAMENTGGILGVIANNLKCNPRTVQNYIKEYATVKEAWRGERLRLRSAAERTIVKHVSDGSLKAAMFIINQLDPETGEFTPPMMRNIITGKDGGPIEQNTHVFSHEAVSAALASRSTSYRVPSGADENDSDGA